MSAPESATRYRLVGVYARSKQHLEAFCSEHCTLCYLLIAYTPHSADLRVQACACVLVQGATSAAEGMGRAFSSSAYASAGHKGRQHPPGSLPANQSHGVQDASGAEAMAPADMDLGAQDQVMLSPHFNLSNITASCRLFWLNICNNDREASVSRAWHVHRIAVWQDSGRYLWW